MSLNTPYLLVNTLEQKLYLYHYNQVKKTYLVSTAKAGLGEKNGSEKTPRGQHIIRAKIGESCPINTVFIGRRPTGEIYTPDLAAKHPKRDWILTRILWLSGLEKGKNRLGEIDTMQRYIYIHGTPDSEPLGIPLSHGCIRMHNEELLELFQNIPPLTKITIE